MNYKGVCRTAQATPGLLISTNSPKEPQPNHGQFSAYIFFYSLQEYSSFSLRLHKGGASKIRHEDFLRPSSFVCV